MKRILSFLAASVLALFFTTVVRANITMSGLTFSENFDSLASLTVSSPPGTPPNVVALGTTGFYAGQILGTGTNDWSLIQNNGAGNSGGLYSFGATGDADRALGVIASGTRVMAFGTQIVNASGVAWKDVTISFTQENWRSSTTTQNVVIASWSTTADVADFLYSQSGFTSVSALDLEGPPPVANPNGALDGNLSSNQASRSFTFVDLNLGIGQSLFVRWQDTNDFGNDAGLAIDNLSISASAVPEPTSIALLGCVMAGAAGLRFRRSFAK